MKEKGRNSEGQINKEEIVKLSEKEFRVTIVKMIQNLKNRMGKIKININFKYVHKHIHVMHV